ncbi:uncharacterized protein LTR77_000532 [Saxophila tyrrhenica]|uniref:Uncharacterized protein n=1 Tax=Saxophila tyrrhenica TaxID=1690608 RepID=A0AAV9PSS1_9PEZI|nr:hypothetical protein LTR77_000532 [Saxophila tyrrhenica]
MVVWNWDTTASEAWQIGEDLWKFRRKQKVWYWAIFGAMPGTAVWEEKMANNEKASLNNEYPTPPPIVRPAFPVMLGKLQEANETRIVKEKEGDSQWRTGPRFLARGSRTLTGPLM